MLELYRKGTTDFSRHGIALNASQAEVNFQDKGRYDIDIVMPYDERIEIDYGMIIRSPVPRQHVNAITLGTVSYWEVSEGQGVAQTISTTTVINYPAWQSGREYAQGEKVTFANKNYQASTAITNVLTTGAPPSLPNNWTQIARTGSGGTYNTGVPLYATVPVRKTISYKAWEYGKEYAQGDKVSYNKKNYQASTAITGVLTTGAPPVLPNNWTEIPRQQTSGGKVAAYLSEGAQLIKTGDYNEQYMQAADLSGNVGFIEISRCTDLSETETRTYPAQDISEQNFVITGLRKSTDKKTISIHAEHVSYQLARTLLGECNITRANPATALLFIQGAMMEEYPGSIYTNMTDQLITGDMSWKNAQNVIMDPKAGFLQATGARMIRNDMDVFLLAEEDATPRYSITYGVNLKKVQWDGDVGDIVTRIYPLAQTEDGNTMMLPEEYIDTVRTVPFVRPEPLRTGLKVGQKEKQADGSEIELTQDMVFARMRDAAGNRFSIDKCDRAKITLEVDWEHLPDTEEYKEYAALQNCAPGEWAQVTNLPMGISESIQLTGYTFDAIRLKYKKGTFGEKTAGGTIAGYELSSGSVSGRVLAAGAVGSQNLMADSITAREILAGSITADKIASRSIVTELLAANSITAEEILAGSITAEKIAAQAITAEKINAGAVTADKIAAGAITAVKIDTNSISAINAKLGTATIVNGIINNADISYANIVDASIQSLIARDAVTDKYFIDKLQVRNLQSVEATVGELVIKASDNKYYRLDVGSGGTLRPTEVTLTAAEIATGVTSNGHGAIIETDLTVADLSASNIKGINALIDKLTASRIDVSELWARQAFIDQLMVTDISSNTYIQSTIGNWASQSTITQTINSLDSRISSLGYGTVYMQPEEPDHGELVAGDIWIQTQSSGTWEQVYQDYASWSAIYSGVSTWQTLGGVSIMWVWDGRKWQKQLDNLDSDTFETEIQQNAQQIQLLATRTTAVEGDLNNKYTIRSGIAITAEGIDISGSQYVKIASGGYFQVQTGNFGIDTNSSTYVIWSGASTAANSPFWVKKDGTIYATSGTIGGWSLAANSLSSGSGSSHIELASSGTYAMWAGAASAASAPFRLKPDGTLYITSLIAVGENGSETTVNLRTAGLWKLNYGTIKSLTVSDGYCTSMTFSNAVSGSTTVNFRRAVSVYLTGSWSGRTFTVTETGTGQTYSETPTYRTGAGSGPLDSIPVDSFDAQHYAYARVMQSSGQGGNVLFGFKIDANSQYEAGWLAGYNAAAGKVSVSGSTSGTIHFPKPTTTYGTEEEGQWSITADVANTAAGWYMGTAYINGIQRASRSRQFS